MLSLESEMSFSDYLQVAKLQGEETEICKVSLEVMEKNHIIPQGSTEILMQVIDRLKERDSLYWLDPNAKLKVKHYRNH